MRRRAQASAQLDLFKGETMSDTDPQPAQQPKRSPEPDRLLERFDAQKKTLQRFVITTISVGAQDGLSPEQVGLLREGLEVLGWLPRDVKV